MAAPDRAPPRESVSHPDRVRPRPAPPARGQVTRGAPHVRDSLDVQRVVGWWLAALAPTALLGAWNTGFQALSAAQGLGLDAVPGWRGAVLAGAGLPAAPGSALACVLYGLACLVPALAVAGLAGALVGVVFARARGRAPGATLPLVVVLFVLMLPPDLPLWQVALGAAFGVAVGLEVFGGTGRNVVNPAVVGVALLYFAYPGGFSGAGAWVALDGAEAATALGLAAEGGTAALDAADRTLADAFLGREPGAPGETSALACLLGGALLLYGRLASWRIVAGGVLGLAATAAAAGALADPGRPLAGLSPAWHLSAGGFAFALLFLATDPVTSAATRGGRWALGLWIGFFVALVRIFNPAHREGVLMAVLLGNVLAPLFDHVAVRAWAWRRRRRHG